MNKIKQPILSRAISPPCWWELIRLCRTSARETQLSVPFASLLSRKRVMYMETLSPDCSGHSGVSAAKRFVAIWAQREEPLSHPTHVTRTSPISHALILFGHLYPPPRPLPQNRGGLLARRARPDERKASPGTTISDHYCVPNPKRERNEKLASGRAVAPREPRQLPYFSGSSRS